MAIFLGTKSFLNDFVLNWAADASLRVPIQKQIVFPPYILTDTFDACLKKKFLIDPTKIKSVDKEERPLKCLFPPQLHKIVIRCGRPLWKAYGNYNDALNLAITKLNSESGMFDLTAFIIRTGALIIPQSPLSHQLVLSGLATLLHVDAFGSNCLTYYHPEPLVSNAARLRMTDDVRFARGLGQFLLRMNSGTFKNTGVAGEIVAKLILLRGFDRSLLRKFEDEDANNAHYFKFIFSHGSFVCPKYGLTTVLDFLATFTKLPQESLKVLDKSGKLLEGFVSLNQFTQVEEGTVIDQLFLVNGFARSTAFSLWQRAPGADLIIPILKKDGSLGCIAVQAKNYSNHPNPEKTQTIVEKLSANYMRFLDFGACGDYDTLDPEENIIRIVIEFGPQKRVRTKSSFHSLHTNDVVLWLKGLPALEHLLEAPALENPVEAPITSRRSAFFEQDVYTVNVRATDETFKLIKNRLYKILVNERDYYKGIIYKCNSRLSLRQTSQVGARTLSITGSPCSNNKYLSLFDAQGRKHYKDKRVEVLEMFEKVGVSEKMIDYRPEFTFTSICNGFQVRSNSSIDENIENAEMTVVTDDATITSPLETMDENIENDEENTVDDDSTIISEKLTAAASSRSAVDASKRAFSEEMPSSVDKRPRTTLSKFERVKK